MRHNRLVASFETPREALAGSIRDLLGAVDEAGGAEDWTLRPSGPASRDCLANEQPSGWGTHPLRDAYQTGTMLWYVAYHDALAVADLLDSGRGIGLLVVSRSLAEASARCEMLMRFGTMPELRIRRMINERLYALHEDWRYTKDVPALDSSWQIPTCERLIDVGVYEFGLPVQRPNDRSAGWVGAARESTMKILGDLLGSPMYAGMFYRNTSALSHAAIHGLTKHLEVESAHGEMYRARIRPMTDAEATVQIHAALKALATAAAVLIRQAGWATERFATADAALDRLTQALMSE